MTTTELLNDLVATTATGDGLPDLGEVLTTAVNPDAASSLPLTIGQTAELLGVSAHTLRYYERIGLVDVNRSGSGRRRYDRVSLGRVAFITRLRLSGMPIRDIARYIELARQGAGTVDQRLELLRRHRDRVQHRLDELTFALAVIDYKIATYGGACSG